MRPRRSFANNDAVIGALMVHRGEADGLITGVLGGFQKKLKIMLDVIGKRPGGRTVGTLGVATTETGAYFVCDTHVNPDPNAEQIAEITRMAANVVRMFGIEPRVALLSHSSFGSHNDESAHKMRDATEIISAAEPELEVEGEMPADMALDVAYRRKVFPNSRLKGPANLLVMPDLDSAHISFNLARLAGKRRDRRPHPVGNGAACAYTDAFRHGPAGGEHDRDCRR